MVAGKAARAAPTEAYCWRTSSWALADQVCIRCLSLHISTVSKAETMISVPISLNAARCLAKNGRSGSIVGTISFTS